MQSDCCRMRINSDWITYSGAWQCRGVLEELPAPDAVFVGGSGGELEDIFKIILKKNPHVRIVITAVTLETVQERYGCWSRTDLIRHRLYRLP